MPDLVIDGACDIALTNFILGHIKEGSTVIDVGSNIGYTTILLGRRVGKKWKSVCLCRTSIMFLYVSRKRLEGGRSARRQCGDLLAEAFVLVAGFRKRKPAHLGHCRSAISTTRRSSARLAPLAA